MQRLSRTTARIRAQAIALTLLAHGVVALVLIELERRAPRRSEAPQLQYVGIWPQPPHEPPRIEESPTRTQTRKSPRASTAIQIPVQTPVPQSTEPPSQAYAIQQDRSQSPVDWNAAAANAAKRFAQGNGAPETFSPPPQPQRKPCKPRRFDAQTEELMAQRLPPPVDPDPVGADPKANCIVVGGFPKCVRKLTFRPRKRFTLSTDLLAETVAGKPPVSSVPASDQCE